jgi:general secretion pathway protein D
MAKRLIACSLAALVAGCFQPMKPSPVHLPGKPPAAEPSAPSASIPAPVQMTTVLPKPRPTTKPETYSVVVNNVRVHELLFALARDARLNVDIHPGITGSVTLNAVDQTLPQLLNRIGRQVDMRWELDGPNLAVMPDSPYLRTYKIDYVNMERQTTGTVSVAAQIATTGVQPGAAGAGGAGGSASGTNASTVSVRNTSTNKFWETLIKNVEELLRETDKIIPGTTPGQPATAAPPAAAGAPGAPGATPPGASVPATPNIQFREAASVIANPEAGVLSIRATSRQHEKIQEFLDQVMTSARRQVLLEGTIVEVELNNQFQQGIDWSRVRDGLAGFSFGQGVGIGPGNTGGQQSLGIINTAPLAASTTGSIFTMGYSARNLSATLRLLESFGTVRVLSSPRLSALNNQTAILKVVDNRVYFTVSGNISPGTINSAAIATFTSTANVVPVGFVMNVTPQISESDSVTLNLKPTISRIIGRGVADPNPVLRNPCFLSNSANCNIPPIENRIPEVQTREMESIIRVTNGQIAVMGGLIQDSYTDNEDSIPGVNRLPLVGGAFGNQIRTSGKTELVIFLRPVVVRDPSLDGDYRGYRVMLPGEDFLTRPNPGRRRIGDGEDRTP